MVWGTVAARAQPLLSCGACPSHRWNFFSCENRLLCRDEQKKAKDVISPPSGDCSDRLGRCLLVVPVGARVGVPRTQVPLACQWPGRQGVWALCSHQRSGSRGRHKQLPGGIALGSRVCPGTATPEHTCACLRGLAREVVALLACQAPISVCECCCGQWRPSAPLPLELACAPSQPLTAPGLQGPGPLAC